ncbi:hypothetical protein [Halorientalis litorea]|uniref:hypothetical protein n=1 Tax=Halorientalis litorea TaxID=2931977 RepID=UPI001FF4FA6C|nr:hypothetical protein [Halorientalis litorea]
MVLEHYSRGVTQHRDRERVVTHRSTCPDCEGRVVDGQGLLYCRGCRWTGRVV